MTELFGQALRDANRNVAPKPEDWPLLINKVKAMWAGFRELAGCR